MRISDWSSDVCSSDLSHPLAEFALRDPVLAPQLAQEAPLPCRYVVLQRAALQQSRKGPENDAGEIADAVFRVGVIFRRMPERLVLLCQKILPFTQTLEPYDSSGNSFRPPI